jgi:hypothetical protein
LCPDLNTHGAGRVHIQRGKDEIMGIGLGIVLTLVGLILLMQVVNVDVPWVDDHRLGVLLVIVGVVELVLVVIMNATRRSTTVVEHEHEVR